VRHFAPFDRWLSITALEPSQAALAVPAVPAALAVPAAAVAVVAAPWRTSPTAVRVALPTWQMAAVAVADFPVDRAAVPWVEPRVEPRVAVPAKSTVLLRAAQAVPAVA
jgi:hypothetical protein